MPRNHGANQRMFVEKMIETGDKDYAARQAGYAFPAQGAFNALQRPNVQKEILDGQMQIIISELLPLSIAGMRRILGDPKTSDANFIKATAVVWRKAFEPADATAGKELHEMTASEIEQLLEATKARLIDVTPSNVFD